jgi:hypothetical protein
LDLGVQLGRIELEIIATDVFGAVHRGIGVGHQHENHPDDLNTSEQGDTANIKQNTTNKGFFRGRRMK